MSQDIFGLVLAGGKSQRMGEDKGLIDWHGKPQRYYLSDLLSTLTKKTYISCRADQAKAIENAGYTPLADNSEAKAQFGAIISAFSLNPGVAWLVVACDLVHVDERALRYLIDNRDQSKFATAYRDNTGLPEPLIAIWESSAFDLLKNEHSAGITCPRKTLIRNAERVKLIDPEKPEYIENVNTPESAAEARKFINKRYY